MDMPATEEQIRTLAFYFWEKDGSPDERSQAYWERARARYDALECGTRERRVGRVLTRNRVKR